MLVTGGQAQCHLSKSGRGQDRGFVFSMKRDIYAGSRSAAAVCVRLWIHVEDQVVTFRHVEYRQTQARCLV